MCYDLNTVMRQPSDIRPSASHLVWSFLLIRVLHGSWMLRAKTGCGKGHNKLCAPSWGTQPPRSGVSPPQGLLLAQQTAHPPPPHPPPPVQQPLCQNMLMAGKARAALFQKHSRRPHDQSMPANRRLMHELMTDAGTASMTRPMQQGS